MGWVFKVTVWLIVLSAFLLYTHGENVSRTNELSERNSRLSADACKCTNGECVNEEGKDVCKCPPGFGNLSSTYCKACGCGPNKSCKFISKGWFETETICFCDPGYIEDNGNCVEITGTLFPEPTSTIEEQTSYETSLDDIAESTEVPECDCGVYGACHFKNGRKKCTCARFTDELNGKCVECVCGAHTDSCYFRSDGTKICGCHYKFIYVNGQCRECYCGLHGLCIFELGRKKCICSPNYIEKDGLCIVNEYNTTVASTSSSLMTSILTSAVTSCNCGLGGTCRWGSSGEKICNCFSGYAPYNSHCYECDCGVNGKCSLETGIKRCTCESNYAENFGKCKYCSCGGNSKSCHFNVLGGKECNCSSGYAELRGYCAECNCGPYGSCNFEYDIKRCKCKPFAVERNGECVDTDGDVIITRDPEDETENDHTSYSTKISSTTLSETTTSQNCICGEYSKSCRFDWKGNKKCDCIPGYVEKYGTCEAICNKDKCLHGKCEIAGKGYKCRCNEGFTGQRCEEKIQKKSSKQDLWMLLQLSVVFAIFILLSGMFCFWTRMLNKISKK